MPNKTEHYQLNQYEPGDNFLRMNFNEDNATVDGVLHRLDTEKCGMVFGSYMGNGSSDRVIPLPVKPKIVLLFMKNGETYRAPSTIGGMAFQGVPLYAGTGSGIAMELRENGFWVSENRGTYAFTNAENRMYYYVAFL